MRLSSRLSLFFIGSLTVALVGFSVTLYLLASKYLYRQIDERLEAAVNTLAAAAEIGPGGVEWEPHERSLSFGRRILEGQLAWQVCDECGNRLDGSGTGGTERILTGAMSTSFSTTRPGSYLDDQGITWRAMHRRLESSTAGREPTQKPASAAEIHAALFVNVAVSTESVQITLRNLALALAGLSAGMWLAALLCGKRISRRALFPVTTMASAAHAIGGDELHQRLPVSHTRDELEELGMSFNALLDRLQESFERQHRFTGDASHQLRTPLTAIQGQVDLALRQDRDAEEYRRVLVLVQRRTRDLRQIVESLLFLARADHDHLELKLETIDLAEWLGEHARSWHDSRRRQDLRLEAAGGGPYRVRVQPLLFAELIDNLLDNASRYSAPGTPIQLTVARDQASVVVAVEDEGMGISEHDIPHVFEPFYRSADARLRGSSGSGLGLAVALRLARSFGGTIAVERRAGRGSRFTVLLPLDTTTDLAVTEKDCEFPNHECAPAAH